MLYQHFKKSPLSQQGTVTAFSRTFDLGAKPTFALTNATATVTGGVIKISSEAAQISDRQRIFIRDTTNALGANSAKTITAGFRYPNSNYASTLMGAGICLKDTVTGKCFAFYHNLYTPPTGNFLYNNLSSDSVGQPTVNGTFSWLSPDYVPVQNATFYLRVVDDGTTNITCYYSTDNSSYTQVYQVARTSQLTNGSGEIGLISYSWTGAACDFDIVSYTVT